MFELKLNPYDKKAEVVTPFVKIFDNTNAFLPLLMQLFLLYSGSNLYYCLQSDDIHFGVNVFCIGAKVYRLRRQIIHLDCGVCRSSLCNLRITFMTPASPSNRVKVSEHSRILKLLSDL